MTEITRNIFFLLRKQRMKKENLIGLVTALVSLLALIYLLAGDSHFPIIQWPYQALQGLVFSFVWGFGVSASVGYAYSILLTLGVCIIFFAIGHKLTRILTSSRK